MNLKTKTLLLFFVIISCNSKEKKVEKIRFNISTEKEIFNLGDSIPIFLKFKNINSKKSIVLNSRMGIGYRNTDDREIYFEITNHKTLKPYREHEKFQVDYKPTLPGIKVLLHDEEIKKEVDLNFWYKFTKKGIYNIKAFYNQEIDENYPEIKKLELVSNEIMITIN